MGAKRPKFELRQVRTDGTEKIELCSLEETLKQVEEISVGRREFLSILAIAGSTVLLSSCITPPGVEPTSTPDVIMCQSVCEDILAHTSSVNSVLFSPNGKLLVSGSEDNTIKIWDPSSGELLMTLKGGGRSVSFSPDGKLLASGYNIKLWDPSSGELLMTLKGHGHHVSFSPNGKLLASGSDDNTIKIWDPSSGELLMTLKGGGTFCFV